MSKATNTRVSHNVRCPQGKQSPSKKDGVRCCDCVERRFPRLSESRLAKKRGSVLGTGAMGENEKQCSRQLQCEVPCSVSNVINSSLFINSSLSSLSSTSHAVGGGPAMGGSGKGRGVGEGEGVRGRGQGIFWSSCHYCTTTWCFALKGLRTIRPTTLPHLHDFDNMFRAHTQSFCT